MPLHIPPKNSILSWKKPWKAEQWSQNTEKENPELPFAMQASETIQSSMYFQPLTQGCDHT